MPGRPSWATNAGSVACARNSFFVVMPAASKSSATSTRFLPGGIVTATSSSAAPFTSTSSICLGVAGATMT